VTDKIVELYKPIFFIDKEEEFFPVSFEEMKINWKDVQMNSPGFELLTANFTNNTFNENAPVYVDIVRFEYGYKLIYAT